MIRGRVALKVGAWTVCLLPLALLVHRALTEGLGANPISYATNWLGDWTLRILLASLAVTPLRIVFGLSWPLALRRLLGLFALFYAISRRLFLKDTGRKLAHVDRQLRTADTIAQDLSERLSRDA